MASRVEPREHARVSRQGGGGWVNRHSHRPSHGSPADRDSACDRRHFRTHLRHRLERYRTSRARDLASSPRAPAPESKQEEQQIARLTTAIQFHIRLLLPLRIPIFPFDMPCRIDPLHSRSPRRDSDRIRWGSPRRHRSGAPGATRPSLRHSNRHPSVETHSAAGSSGRADEHGSDADALRGIPRRFRSSDLHSCILVHPRSDRFSSARPALFVEVRRERVGSWYP